MDRKLCSICGEGKIVNELDGIFSTNAEYQEQPEKEEKTTEAGFDEINL